MSKGGPLVLLLFVLGLLGGIGLGQATRERAPANPYGTLPLTAEPAAAAAIIDAIRIDDAHALANQLDGELLGSLGEAIDPVVDVLEVRFAGASERSGDTLSAYVVQGRTLQGQELLVGFVLRVRGDKVVGIN